MTRPQALNGKKMITTKAVQVEADLALQKWAARVFLAALILCIVCHASQTALAVVYTYTPTNSTTDLWSLGTGWSLPPQSDAATELTFVGDTSTVIAGGLKNASTNDLVGPFSLNVLTLQGTGPASGSATIAVNSSSASSYLNFVSNGSMAPVVNLNAASGAAGFSYMIKSNIALVNDTTFQGNGTADFYVAGSISGEGGLTKSGTSTLMLLGNNTYGGTTKVCGGVLAIANWKALSNSTLDYNNYGGSVVFYSYPQIVLGGLQGDQDLPLISDGFVDGVTLIIGGNNSSGTYSGVLSDTGAFMGTGKLRKQGSGILTLAGANTYRGSTTIDGGVIRLSGGDNRLPTSTTVSLANVAGVLLDLNGQNQTIAGLSGGGANGGNVSLGSGTLTIATTANTTYAGAISGSTGNLIKQGTGTLTLTGNSTYGGATTINAGKIQLSGGSNRLPLSTAIVFTGGTLDLNNQNQTIGSLSGPGAITLGSGTLTVGDGTSTIYSGTISGAGNLTKQGDGTLTFSGPFCTYQGTTTINGGTLRLAADHNLWYTTAITLADATGVTLDLNGHSTTISALNGGGTNGGNVTLGSGTLEFIGGTGSYGGVISGAGGGLQLGQGSGLILTGANTYTGPTGINGGTLQLSGGDDRLPVGTAVVFAANSANQLILNGHNQTVASVSGMARVVLNSGTLTVGDGTSTILTGSISGTGNLVKQGSGRLGINTNSAGDFYSGTTTVNGGTLALQSGLFKSSTAVTLADVPGATFEVGYDASATVGSINGGGVHGGTISISGSLGIADATDMTYSGTIFNHGSLGKLGTGTLTLAPTATIAADGNAMMVINAGTVRLSSDNCLSRYLTVMFTGGTLDINGTSQTIGALGSVMPTATGNVLLGSGTLTVMLQMEPNATSVYHGVISGSGTLVKDGAGTMALTGMNTYTGATVIDGGTLRLWANNTLPANTAVIVANTVGATLDLYGHSATIGSLSGGGSNGGNIIVTNRAQLVVGNADNTLFAGAISGTGTLVKQGEGTLVLSGENTYSLGTTINVGVLALGADNALPTGSAVRLGGGTLGTGGFSQTNALGTLTLSNDSFIDLGEIGASVLKFADSHSAAWSGMLTIDHWNGSFTGGGADELFFGSSASGLTAAQLSEIVFENPNGLSGDFSARMLPTGEIVPVPEPTTFALLITGALALGGVGLRRWRR